MRSETPTPEEARELLNDIIADTDGKLFERRVIAKLLSSERVKPKMYVPIKLLEGSAMPTYAHETDAGADLVSIEDVDLHPLEPWPVKTGVSVAIPEGHAGFILPRSGLALNKGVTVANAPGLIDAGYRGEIKVILVNISNYAQHISKGDRIAQFLIAPVPKIDFVQVADLDETPRGANGFGSTGK